MCKFVANNNYRFVVSQKDLVDGSYSIGITAFHTYVCIRYHSYQTEANGSTT